MLSQYRYQTNDGNQNNVWRKKECTWVSIYQIEYFQTVHQISQANIKADQYK